MMFLLIALTVFNIGKFVDICDTDNKCNKYGFGAVPYSYCISETEITNKVYCDFLNNVVQKHDSLHLYSSLMGAYFWGGIEKIEDDDSTFFKVKEGYENYPVAGVSWNSAIRFANWLNYNIDNIDSNRPLNEFCPYTDGDDKHGAYNTDSVTGRKNIRNIGAVYYLPNRDEWTKACFYNGKEYIEYQSNSVNCYNSNGWKYPFPHLTEASCGPRSHYGTVNQVGNLAEWVEDNAPQHGWKLFLGGSLIRPLYSSKMNYIEADAPDKSIASVGLRIIKISTGNIDTDILRPSGIDKKLPYKNRTAISESHDLNGGTYVEVGNAENTGDILNSYKGCVNYVYEISKYELTNSEYARFLSSVCRYDDPFSLYNHNMTDGALGGICKEIKNEECVYKAKPGWENKPVTYITYYSLCRYANWLHYGCPDSGDARLGTTEGDKTHGAYDTRFFEDIKSGKRKPNRRSIKRNKGATYFIPNDDEWYKAAYYDPYITGKNKYHLYPTRSSSRPTPNEANYMSEDSLAVGPPYYVSDVMAYDNASSYYGTCNQGGNVWEWIEGWQYNKIGNIKLRGGSFSYTEYGLSSLNEDPGGINDISFVFGGRIARIYDGYAGGGIPSLKNIYYSLISSMISTPYTGLLLSIAIITIVIMFIFWKKIKTTLYSTYRWSINITIWLIRRNHVKYKPDTGLVLMIPCDPWSVFGSRGDEAMLEACMKYNSGIEKAVKYKYIVADTVTFDNVKRRKYDATVSWRGISPLNNIIHEIKKTRPEKVIIIGADCMDGYYSSEVSFTLMAAADICSRNSINYTLTGFSFNGTPKKELKLPYLLSHNELIYKIRDSVSLSRFKSFSHKKTKLVADVAFLLEPDYNFPNFEAYKSWTDNVRQTPGRVIMGFNYHPMLEQKQGDEEIINNAKRIGENLSGLLKHQDNLYIIFIPHDDRGKLSDNIVLPIVAGKLKENGYADRFYRIESVHHAAEIKAITVLCDFILCSRMHLSIAALGMGVPVIVVKYQDKFDGLFKHFDYPSEYLLSQRDLISETMTNTITDFISQYHILKRKVEDKLPTVIRLSQNNFKQ